MVEGLALTEQALLRTQKQRHDNAHVEGPSPGTPSSPGSLVGGRARDSSGTSALVFLLQSGGRSINVAWVGDSRAVLCREGRAIDLTRERTRAQRDNAVSLAGGPPVPGRNVSRALGGYDAKTGRKIAGLNAQPQLRSEALQPEDEFVLLGSRGLWEALSPSEAVDIARAELRAYDDTHMVAEKLVDVAIRRGATSSVTVVFVRLFPRRGTPTEGPRTLPQKCSFLHVPTSHNFVRVVGGFGAPTPASAPPPFVPPLLPTGGSGGWM